MFFDVFVRGSDVAGRVVVSSRVASKVDGSCGGRIDDPSTRNCVCFEENLACSSKNEEFFCCRNAPISKLLFTMVATSSVTVLTSDCSVVLDLGGDLRFPLHA